MIRDFIADVISGGRLTEYKMALLESQEEVRFHSLRAARFWVALREIHSMRPWKNETSIEAKMANRAMKETCPE